MGRVKGKIGRGVLSVDGKALEIGGIEMSDEERFVRIKDTHNRCVRLQYESISWLIEQAEQNQKLREALEFYADAQNYISPTYDAYGQCNISFVQRDEGKLASKTLEELK